jgi:hypothetical protein
MSIIMDVYSLGEHLRNYVWDKNYLIIDSKKYEWVEMYYDDPKVHVCLRKTTNWRDELRITIKKDKDEIRRFELNYDREVSIMFNGELVFSKRLDYIELDVFDVFDRYCTDYYLIKVKNEFVKMARPQEYECLSMYGEMKKYNAEYIKAREEEKNRKEEEIKRERSRVVDYSFIEIDEENMIKNVKDKWWKYIDKENKIYAYCQLRVRADLDICYNYQCDGEIYMTVSKGENFMCKKKGVYLSFKNEEIDIFDVYDIASEDEILIKIKDGLKKIIIRDLEEVDKRNTKLYRVDGILNRIEYNDEGIYISYWLGDNEQFLIKSRERVKMSSFDHALLNVRVINRGRGYEMKYDHEYKPIEFVYQEGKDIFEVFMYNCKYDSLIEIAKLFRAKCIVRYKDEIKAEKEARVEKALIKKRIAYIESVTEKLKAIKAFVEAKAERKRARAEIRRARAERKRAKELRIWEEEERRRRIETGEEEEDEKENEKIHALMCQAFMNRVKL